MDLDNNFLIVASPRSGSNYLCYLLNAQQDVMCHLELFHPDVVPLKIRDWHQFGRQITTKMRDRNPEKYVKKVFARHQFSQRPIKHIGGKLLLSESQIESGLVPLLKHTGKIILLERKNKLAWYSSLNIASQTGDWFNHPRTEYNTKIIFDLLNYQDSLTLEKNLFNQIIRQISLVKHSVLRVYYEDFQSEETFQKVADFIGIPKIEFFPDSAFAKPRNFLNSFENPEMVISYAKAAQVEHWLA